MIYAHVSEVSATLHTDLGDVYLGAPRSVRIEGALITFTFEALDIKFGRADTMTTRIGDFRTTHPTNLPEVLPGVDLTIIQSVNMTLEST